MDAKPQNLSHKGKKIYYGNSIKNKNIDRYGKHPAYRNFISSLKSPATKTGYSFALSKYLNSETNKNLTLDKILSKPIKIIESEIIEEIIKQQEDENLTCSSTLMFLSAVNHFFSINDVIINRKKIKKFIGEQTNKYDFRPYTIEEISKLLQICDERDKAIVLLFASTGMRVGALPELNFKHLKKWKVDKQGNYVYRIEAYSSSIKFRYFTFCTPEAAKALDSYLELRKRCGEKIKLDPNTGDWLPGDTPLLIRQFDKTKYFHPVKRLKVSTLGQQIIVPKLQQLGFREKLILTAAIASGSGPEIKRSSIKYELHPCHSFRIFAVTQMQRSKVDKTIREMLVGHSTGLDKAYYKPQEEEILQEYLKAVDLLTINNENRLKHKINELAEKNDVNQYVITSKLMERDKEIEKLKEKGKENDDAYVALSDQLMILREEVQQLKTRGA